MDIYTLQKLMTHSDTKTTERYATIADERLKSASANASSLIEKRVIQCPKQTEAAGYVTAGEKMYEKSRFENVGEKVD